jgi:hypothetical protein
MMLCAPFAFDCSANPSDCNITCEESGCGPGTCFNDLCTCANVMMN